MGKVAVVAVHDYNFLILLLLLLFSNFTNQSQSLPILSPSDLSTLSDIKNTLTDIPSSSSAHFFSSWNFNSPDPCSSFAGVTCTSIVSDHRRVTTLTLGTGLSDSPGLAGSLPPSLSNLTELTQLILFPGIVTGPIPPQLGSLKNLRVISLTSNRLTGSIPASLSTLSNLHTLDLSYNQLTGSVPANLKSGLPTLKVLVLASNRLSGHLPELPTQLLHLDVRNNCISGTLPEVVPLTLRYMSVSINKMWGPLNVLDAISQKLVYLDLSMNQFSGPIPSSLLSCASLTSILLQRNNLSGGVPVSPSSSSYGPGSIVDLSHNILTGELSTVFVGVESLFLNNNRMTGKVPAAYFLSVNNGRIKTLYLQHNYFSGFMEYGSITDGLAASVCLNYNCMVPLTWMTECPVSAGDQISRPAYQCDAFYNRSLIY